MRVTVLPPELPEASEVDRAVRMVLARPEFAERSLPGALQWLGDLYSSAREALLGMVADALGRSGPVLFWVVAGFLAVPLVAILTVLGKTAVQAWHSHRGRRNRSDELDAREVAETDGTIAPAAWEARAREEAADGRLREAAFALYRAVLLRMDERNQLSYDPSKTPGDYRRETPRGSRTGGELRQFLDRFEPIAFGGRTVSRTAYDRLASAAREAGARA